MRERRSCHRNSSGGLVVRLVGGVGLFLTVCALNGCDTIPPGPVTGFAATGQAGQISLRWTNPADGDLAGVRWAQGRIDGAGVDD